jgi:lysophospholipid acyltransferase (LPLAT)-like uncharacterized protein
MPAPAEQTHAERPRPARDERDPRTIERDPLMVERDAKAAERDARTDERDARVVERAYSFADLSGYTFRQRLAIRAADLAFYSVIRLVGATARFRVEGWEHWEAATREGRQPIYTFWHEQILAGSYFWRGRGIVVMTSRSFDGEYIARFIRRLGYGAARGSSSRGAISALAEMVRLARAGRPTGFSIDGPRGPRRVAKPGAVLLAKKTGNPVLPFTLTPARYYAAPSWDRLQVPLPFTIVRVRIAPPIFVPPDADDAALAAKRDELQRALDSLSD